jgi:hypothetical protein
MRGITDDVVVSGSETAAIRCRSVVRQWADTYAKSRYKHGDLVGTLRGRGGLTHQGGVGRRDHGAVVSHGECIGVYL